MSRTAFITIAGHTNVGKSSLLNAIVGKKIAAVSCKSQTTRTRIIGIRNINDVQIVLFDTPGLHKPVNKLGEYMINIIRKSIIGIDAVLFVHSCKNKINDHEIDFIRSLNNAKMPVILVINKIDLIHKKKDLAEYIEEFPSKLDFQAVIPVSVKEKNGVDIVINKIINISQESVHYFPADIITDQSEKVIVAEIIREKFLELLKDEVPHGIAIIIEKMSKRNNKDIFDISAVIYCERMSHKSILIGKGGSMLKKISTAARIEMEDFFCIKINLKCWVKIKKDWRNKEGMIKRFCFF